MAFRSRTVFQVVDVRSAEGYFLVKVPEWYLGQLVQVSLHDIEPAARVLLYDGKYIFAEADLAATTQDELRPRHWEIS